MPEQAYAAAGRIASEVHAHFRGHLEDARKRGETDLAQLPDERTLARTMDAAFWASLRREEGYSPKLSLAFLDADRTSHPVVFARPVPLEPGLLTRVAPAVERPGIHLGVSPNHEELVVWGAARSLPRHCCVIEAPEPGLVVVKHHRGDTQAKFVNVAVLQGDRVKVIDEHASSLPDCPELLSSLLGFDSPASWAGNLNVLVQLAVSMRAHRRGGLLLVVPAGSDGWRQSMVQPIGYAVSPPYDELALLARGTSEDGSLRTWREDIGRSVDSIAGLTAIDGATILTSQYDLLAFGAKITRRRGARQIEQISLTEPVKDGTAAVVTPGHLGGTRHLSAAQFVQDQHDSLALVASQDGRFTVFAWSPCEDMVHAHRVETLLL